MQSVQITALESFASDGKYTITSPSFEFGQPWAGLLPHLRCQVSLVTNPPKQFSRLTQTGSTSPCLWTSSVPSHEPPVYPVMSQCASLSWLMRASLHVQLNNHWPFPSHRWEGVHTSSAAKVVPLQTVSLMPTEGDEEWILRTRGKAPCLVKNISVNNQIGDK